MRKVKNFTIWERVIKSTRGPWNISKRHQANIYMSPGRKMVSDSFNGMPKKRKKK